MNRRNLLKRLAVGAAVVPALSLLPESKPTEAKPTPALDPRLYGLGMISRASAFEAFNVPEREWSLGWRMDGISLDSTKILRIISE